MSRKALDRWFPHEEMQGAGSSISPEEPALISYATWDRRTNPFSRGSATFASRYLFVWSAEVVRATAKDQLNGRT